MSTMIETDVLVLGAGAAGASAAITAAEAGRSVTVLEASASATHTPNFRMSGGWVMGGSDVPRILTYLRACAGGLVDDAVLQMWARESRGVLRWLENFGIEMRESDGVRGPEHPEFEGSDAIVLRRAWSALPSPIPEQAGWWDPDSACNGGEALYRGLMTALLQSTATVRWNARPSSLLVDDGSVIGALAEIDGQPVEIRARGTIIATGGFGASRELISNYLDVPNTEFYGNPLNDGSGMRLGMAIGADLVRMNRFIGRGVGAFDDPETGLHLGFILNLDGGGYVIVDGGGDRYMNETRQARLAHDVLYVMQEFEPVSGGYTRSPSYYLFDQRRMDAGPLTYPDRGVSTVGLYRWSDDNTKELANGWIGVGDTPSAAAAAVGADPGAFDDAVAEYNRACQSGADPLGRPAETLEPLIAPFYCVPLYVGGPHTSGGLRRDETGRVLAVRDGKPIPGLYSAGELGQAVGLLYPVQGCSLSDAFCSGIVAGRATAGI